MSVRQILSELANVTGRHGLQEHIAALPIEELDVEGETEAEARAKENPLNADEQSQLEKLLARHQQTADNAANAPKGVTSSATE